MRWIQFIATLLIACLGLDGSSPVSQGAGLNPKSKPMVASEAQLKAAFLLNFARFTEWPAQCFPRGGEPLIVGVVGDDPFGEVLDRTLESKVVNNHPLVPKRFRPEETLATCHILFISRSAEDRVPEIVQRLQGRGVLIVGDSDHFLEDGGTIRFLIENGSVAFALNLPAAERVGLRISAKLLRMAKVFKPEARAN